MRISNKSWSDRVASSCVVRGRNWSFPWTRTTSASAESEGGAVGSRSADEKILGNSRRSRSVRRVCAIGSPTWIQFPAIAASNSPSSPVMSRTDHRSRSSHRSSIRSNDGNMLPGPSASSDRSRGSTRVARSRPQRRRQGRKDPNSRCRVDSADREFANRRALGGRAGTARDASPMGGRL